MAPYLVEQEDPGVLMQPSSKSNCLGRPIFGILLGGSYLKGPTLSSGGGVLARLAQPSQFGPFAAATRAA